MNDLAQAISPTITYVDFAAINTESPSPSLTINDKYYITDDRFCHKHRHRSAFTGRCKYFMTQVRWYSCFLGAEYSITSFISLPCDYWEISKMSPIFSYFAADPCEAQNICFRLSEDKPRRIMRNIWLTHKIWVCFSKSETNTEHAKSV